MLTKAQIREIALANGFKLKKQMPSGEEDLNPYVYEFAYELLNRKEKQEMKDDPKQ